jgi:hypothetical protein
VLFRTGEAHEAAGRLDAARVTGTVATAEGVGVVAPLKAASRRSAPRRAAPRVEIAGEGE